jgi:hypothetical protein
MVSLSGDSDAPEGSGQEAALSVAWRADLMSRQIVLAALVAALLAPRAFAQFREFDADPLPDK